MHNRICTDRHQGCMPADACLHIRCRPALILSSVLSYLFAADMSEQAYPRTVHQGPWVSVFAHKHVSYTRNTLQQTVGYTLDSSALDTSPEVQVAVTVPHVPT